MEALTLPLPYVTVKRLFGFFFGCVPAILGDHQIDALADEDGHRDKRFRRNGFEKLLPFWIQIQRAFDATLFPHRVLKFNRRLNLSPYRRWCKTPRLLYKWLALSQGRQTLLGIGSRPEVERAVLFLDRSLEAAQRRREMATSVATTVRAREGPQGSCPQVQGHFLGRASLERRPPGPRLRPARAPEHPGHGAALQRLGAIAPGAPGERFTGGVEPRSGGAPRDEGYTRGTRKKREG